MTSYRCVVVVGHFKVFLGSSESIWSYYGWLRVVIDFFWVVVGSCGYLLVVLGESELLWNNCGLYEVVVGLFWMICIYYYYNRCYKYSIKTK